MQSTILLVLCGLLSACPGGGGASLSSGDVGADGHTVGGGDSGGATTGPLRGSLGTGAGATRDQGDVPDPFSIAAFFAGSSASPPLHNGTALNGAIDAGGMPTGSPGAITGLSFTAPATWPPASASDAISVVLAGGSGTPYISDADYAGAFDPAVAADDSWTRGWTIAIDGSAALWKFFGRDPDSGLSRAPGTALDGQFGPSAQGTQAGCPSGTTFVGLFSEVIGPLEQDETALFERIAGDYDVCRLPARLLPFPLNFQLTNDNVYEIADGFPGTYIGRGEAARPGAQSLIRLQIQAGTLIFGEENESLIVTRGANIQASGLAGAPVVMTSRQQLMARFDGDSATLPAGEAGGWGGLVLMGTARDNQCAPDFPGCDVAAPAGIGFYGGNDDGNETSGFLDYVIIRQGGGDLDASGTRLGGLSLFGAGRNTRIDHVQVHRSGSHGVLVRGGNVFMGHALLTANAEDSLNYGNGWTGGMQFALAIQADDAAENGIRGASGPVTIPVSFPLLANMTVMAPASRTPASRASSNAQGVVLTEGTRGQFWNLLVTGDFFNACLDIDDDETFTRANEAGGVAPDMPGPHLVFGNSVLDCTQFNFNENG